MAEVSLSRGMARAMPGLGPVARIRVVTAIAILLGYEALARSGLLYEGVVPTLPLIVAALWSTLTDAGFYPHLGLTAFEILAGFAIGALSGVVAGIAFGVWRFVGSVLDPWVHYLAPTPKIIFLPILLLLFGIGVGSKIAMGAISAFFPVVVATYAAMRLVRPVLIRVAESYNATRLQVVRLVYLPSLVIPVVGSLRLGLGVAVIGTLLAEIKMSNMGLGYLVIQHYNFFRIPEMYALLLIVFALAWLGNAAMERLARQIGRL